MTAFSPLPERDAGAGDPLAQALSGEPWERCAEPFPHVVARNVFVPSVQAELEAAFEAAFAPKLARRASQAGGARPAWRYDAEILPFTEARKREFPVIMTAAFHRLLASALGLQVTADVDAALHHHEPGSASGWVHNDLNPGWFPPSQDDVNLPDHAHDGYRTGRTVDGVTPVKRVRTATMIYFLGNGAWHDDDGGETGLYASLSQPVAQPSKRIAPHDNSLLLFRCTPHSYHAFLTNPRRARRSIILWLHEPADAAEARWGRDAIVPWFGGAKT